MTAGLTGIPHPSLAAMVDAIQARISREGLHQRFNQGAVAFMAQCASFVLRHKMEGMSAKSATLLNHFKRVLIFDSTSWDIDQKLRDIFPGSGRKAHTSANCKVQLCFEYIRGVISFFDIMPGTKPDNRYSMNLPTLIARGDLLVADLGYFCLDTLSRICSSGAFFLFRFLLGVKLYDAHSGQAIDLPKFLRNTPEDVYELSVVMGDSKKRQVCCRLVCLRVHDTVANERRRKMRRNAQRKSRCISKNHLFMAGWIVMITNIPSWWLPSESVREFYGVRWQIELIFKQMKSVLAIHRSATGNAARFQCEILGKLIMTIVIFRIHAQENNRLWNQHKRQISFEKLHMRIQERMFCFMQLLCCSLRKALDYLQHELEKVLKNCRMLTQKTRRSTLEIIAYEIKGLS
jgi:hypothetical protein